MQDYAQFCRQRIRACFYRRRKYPVNSEEWKYAVSDVRQFIRAYRQAVEVQNDPEYIKARQASDARIRESLEREINSRRTGADLIAALQASPCREIDIEPERYRLDPTRDNDIDYSDIPPPKTCP